MPLKAVLQSRIGGSQRFLRGVGDRFGVEKGFCRSRSQSQKINARLPTPSVQQKSD